LHSPEITLMDSFATLTIFFASISGSSDIPTNADDGGSGNNAYCVVA
ncbi:lipopeptide pheromone with GPI-anchor, partial [Laccaria amethystina LaAM-08-1]